MYAQFAVTTAISQGFVAVTVCFKSMLDMVVRIETPCGVVRISG
jgi:hypothetical protein